MDIELFNLLLALHICFGVSSLLLGLVVLVLPKGNKRHTFIGRIYFYSMLLAALISIVLSCLHPNYFLLIIGVFTSYMLLSGKRYLRIIERKKVRLTDWILSGVMCCFGIVLLIAGGYYLMHSNYFGIVYLLFGGVSLRFVFQDYTNFQEKSRIKNFWLTSHIQRMTGSYIASVTAFLVVNNTLLPGISAWLLPTFILTPLIVIWTRRNAIKA